MSVLHELYGKMVEESQRIYTEHMKTYALLKALKEGTVTLDQVEITEDGWKVG